MDRPHKQVGIYNDTTAELIFVDEGIASIIKALWNSCIMTSFSCQGGHSYNDGSGYIAISSAASRDTVENILNSCGVRYWYWDFATEDEYTNVIRFPKLGLL